MKKIVILTGACGNFGSFISKQLIKNKEIIPVLITSKKIKKKNYHQIDIKKKESIVKIFLYIRKKYGEPDVLINNAAVNTLKGFKIVCFKILHLKIGLMLFALKLITFTSRYVKAFCK